MQKARVAASVACTGSASINRQTSSFLSTADMSALYSSAAQQQALKTTHGAGRPGAVRRHRHRPYRARAPPERPASGFSPGTDPADAARIIRPPVGYCRQWG
jgi:hypothetical protein